MTAEIERIRSIKSFPSLVKYLKEELDWKIETDDIEDLTFEYDAEDLGLDKQTAVKIKEIKQLRPLVTNQPWGIFYISFEKKRLPIVALRRILRSLVLKKRASANRADVATWNMNDLLFISSYGEDIDRELSFAHFSENSALGDLPTLKVLGWNSGNTKLRLEDTVKTLKEKLHWPDDDADTDEWRKQWSSAFTRGYRETVKTSKELAVKLAELAQVIRERVNEAIAVESENGELRKLHKAFQEALIHDLSTDDFADMYAQTIAYGLLSASVSRESGALVADNLKDMVPKTNPFLQELMGTFLTVGGRKGKIDFDELGINEVIELLRHTDMEQVKLDFGAKNPNEDPVIHFYELFLKEYDPEKRMKRGVFYTPRPVVSFIVRSVDEILRTEFGLEDGLADTTTWGEMKKRNKDLDIPEGATESTPFVQILDPATGTGTFLVEVIDLIYKTMTEKWRSQRKSDREIRELWNEYVPQHLLPRVYGFELMMAPYTIAHMKIGLKLRETGYQFLSSERAQIYLTNTLEEPKTVQPYLMTMAPALAHEAQAANGVKRAAPTTVVIGNPPYSNFGMSNKDQWILSLIDEYKEGLGERKINLDDDFIKFIRYGQWRIESTNCGILGFITNNTYLDGITHREMRRSLRRSFQTIRLLDLHGSSKKLERAPDGSKDENVFDIQQGVAIMGLVRGGDQSWESTVRHGELWGVRGGKYSELNRRNLPEISTTRLSNIDQASCLGSFSFFTPKGLENIDEYCEGPSIKGAFIESNTGIQTKRDGLVYQFTEVELKNVILDVTTLEVDQLRAKYELPDDGRDWTIELAKADVSNGKGICTLVHYHPFDSRWTYYSGKTKGFMAYPRSPLMLNALHHNLLLLTVRNPRRGNTDSFFVADRIVDKDGVSPFDNVTFLPLYLYPNEKDRQLGVASRYPNLSAEFIKDFAERLELAYVEAGPRDSLDTFGPEESFYYIYAVLFSPSYRGRYAEFLKIDFPRVPLTNDVDLFRGLCQLGCDLVALHLLKTDYEGTTWARENKMFPTENHRFEFKGIDDVVAAGHPKHDPDSERVYINKTSYFAGIPEAVWNFHIGGYQVCHKWLKDRKGRTLSDEDKLHYNKIAIALGETIRLMAEIDEVIESHGGWPLAGSQDKP